MLLNHNRWTSTKLMKAIGTPQIVAANAVRSSNAGSLGVSRIWYRFNACSRACSLWDKSDLTMLINPLISYVHSIVLRLCAQHAQHSSSDHYCSLPLISIAVAACHITAISCFRNNSNDIDWNANCSVIVVRSCNLAQAKCQPLRFLSLNNHIVICAWKANVLTIAL